MAMLVASAYDRAGIVAAIGMHFAVNVSLVSLGVTAPETQAMLIGIQSIAVVLVLATGRGTGRPGPLTAVPETAYAPENAART